MRKIFGTWDELPDSSHNTPAKLWHLLAAQHVGTQLQKNNSGLSQRRSEITMLWDLFLRQQPKVILEIGVAQGGTFASWTYLAPDDATLIGIDRDTNDCRPRSNDLVNPEVGDNSNPRMTQEGGGLYALKQGNQVLHAIDGWSFDKSTLDKLDKILAGREIDFLFHDASHQSDMFAKDFKAYWSRIAEGGVFASHDIAPSADPNCDKSVEWSRIKAEETYSACFEFLPHPSVTEMGIGVLIK